jgi:hypothetical protein
LFTLLRPSVTVVNRVNKLRYRRHSVEHTLSTAVRNSLLCRLLLFLSMFTGVFRLTTIIAMRHFAAKDGLKA